MTDLRVPLEQSAFGPLVGGDDVEDYLQQVLERWYPSYLWEIERHTASQPGSLPLPRSLVRSSAVEKFPEDQTPALMLASPGLTDPPIADGGGYYTATWQVNLGVQLVAGPNRRALELARWYTLALRACVLQQQQDPGIPTRLQNARVDWRDERYDLLDSIDDRTVCVGRVEVAVTAAMVLQRGLGPLEPVIPPQPGPDPQSPGWPPATSVHVDVQKIPVSEEP
jgi:hypothetical protein